MKAKARSVREWGFSLRESNSVGRPSTTTPGPDNLWSLACIALGALSTYEEASRSGLKVPPLLERFAHSFQELVETQLLEEYFEEKDVLGFTVSAVGRLLPGLKSIIAAFLGSKITYDEFKARAGRLLKSEVPQTEFDRAIGFFCRDADALLSVGRCPQEIARNLLHGFFGIEQPRTFKDRVKRFELVNGKCGVGDFVAGLNSLLSSADAFGRPEVRAALDALANSKRDLDVRV